MFQEGKKARSHGGIPDPAKRLDHPLRVCCFRMPEKVNKVGNRRRRGRTKVMKHKHCIIQPVPRNNPAKENTKLLDRRVPDLGQDLPDTLPVGSVPALGRRSLQQVGTQHDGSLLEVSNLADFLPCCTIGKPFFHRREEAFLGSVLPGRQKNAWTRAIKLLIPVTFPLLNPYQARTSLRGGGHGPPVIALSLQEAQQALRGEVPLGGVPPAVRVPDPKRSPMPLEVRY